ncbi:hypothetical protein TcWFU_002230 [Taenia crassiceps]|uniref:Uncharacterized protein n=1 Tax=Taenia crassiceps TaxID=6207 RepID=A0ABR4QK26_9CEST
MLSAECLMLSREVRSALVAASDTLDTEIVHKASRLISLKVLPTFSRLLLCLRKYPDNQAIRQRLNRLMWATYFRHSDIGE